METKDRRSKEIRLGIIHARVGEAKRKIDEVRFALDAFYGHLIDAGHTGTEGDFVGVQYEHANQDMHAVLVELRLIEDASRPEALTAAEEAEIIQ